MRQQAIDRPPFFLCAPVSRLGALYIAVIDPGTRRMIWVGVAETRLVPTMSLDRKAKRVDQAVRSILAGFPPR